MHTVNQTSLRIINIFLSISLCLIAKVYADEPALTSLTLKQAYQKALAQSETIAINKEVIQEAHGRFSQSLSTALPQVTFEDTEKWQDGNRSAGDRRYIPSRQFVLTQPLFSGFKEFAAIAGSKAEKLQRQEELIRAKQLLFTDVADAFFLYKSYQEELAVGQAINMALRDRKAEIEKRQSLGRSKPSEVASIDARFYRNEATLESLRSQQDVARELLEFLVGQKIASIANEDIVIEDVPEIDIEAVANARADVKAAMQAYVVAQKKIVVARSGYFPTVDAVGDYYTKRVGASSHIDWDVMLNISVPIFTSGAASGKLKEAKAVAEGARLNQALTKRKSILDIQNSKTKLSSNLKQMQAYKKAVEAAQKNYDLQVEDYGNSKVNNLDVLQSLEDLQNIQQDYIAVKNETQRAFWALKVAMGDINDDTL